jgi:AbrB family looped-hinge helix DNA binding protein
MVVVPARTARRRKTRIGSGGRLVIPAEIREQIGMNEGEPVVMWVENGELRIWTVREGIRRAQQIIRRHVPPDVSLVDELIADRRAEAARE